MDMFSNVLLLLVFRVCSFRQNLLRPSLLHLKVFPRSLVVVNVFNAVDMIAMRFWLPREAREGQQCATASLPTP